jgi:hypothetical protein
VQRRCCGEILGCSSPGKIRLGIEVWLDMDWIESVTYALALVAFVLWTVVVGLYIH